MAQEDQVFLLTQEAYDKMQEELKWREGEYRDEIIAKVSAARAEGDLSENGQAASCQDSYRTARRQGRRRFAGHARYERPREGVRAGVA